MDSIIEIDNCSKSYKTWSGYVHALKKVSFNIEPGSICGLIGPNGAGKTTLIKLILGLLKPTEGKIKVFGKNKVDKNSKQQIGFLPEESYLYDFLSIRETVEFAAKLYTNKNHGLSRVEDLLKMVGLEGRDDRKISQCSKGMARRTALAQALVHDPKFIILDEPTSGFDPMGVSDMKSIMLSLKEEGKTILLCSHQLADIEAVCDNIVVFYEGNLVVNGSVQDLLKESKNNMYQIASEKRDLFESLLKNERIDYEFVRSNKGLENFFISSIKKWIANS